MGEMIQIGGAQTPVSVQRTAPPAWFEDGGRFWVENEKGDWVSLTESQFGKHLMMCGFKPATRADRDNGLMSPIDIELMNTVKDRRVAYAGPLAGWPRGVVWFDDNAALVTRSPKLLETEKGDCSLIHALVIGLLDKDGLDQSEYLLGWWAHGLRAYYAGRPTKGMCLALAGEAGCGKTLLKDLIRETFGGRECNPYQWMLGRDSFNRELCEAVVWTIDDEAASTKGEDRIALGASIKQTVANSGIRFRGLHQQAITLNPLRRLIICVNTEPDRILVLPPLDDDIIDKLMIIKAFKGEFPMPVGTEDEKRAFWDALMNQLPAFVHYLLHEHEIAPAMTGRFGVVHFCHPDIREQLWEVSPEVQLWEFLERTVLKMTGQWSGTSTELRNWMCGDSSELGIHERREVPKPAWLGKRLAKLMRKHPDRVVKSRRGDEYIWEIQR